MPSSYRQFTDKRDLPRLLADLGARTVVVDIEPLVAEWDGSQEALDDGIGRVLGGLASVPAVSAVVFATNSARCPSALPAPGFTVSYIVSARKPVHVSTYARLPRPGVVVGDQVLTDGLLARRLDYAFLHYRPPQRAPAGPRILDLAGRVARPLIF